MSDPKEKLIDATNEGYSNLCKWLIGLATGTIIFSVKLVSISTPSFWKNCLAAGLVLLVISIILGIRGVTLRLDGLHYNYLWLENKDRFDANLQRRNEVGEDSEFEKNQKSLQDTIVAADGNMKRVNKQILCLFFWQQLSFYIGIVVVSIFGIYSIRG